jgi:hypothetical protein
MSPAEYENVRVGSVQWLLDGDQQFLPDESDVPPQGERVETVRRSRRWPPRVALAALAVVVIGAGVVFALPEMRSRFAGLKSETASIPPKTTAVAETGQPAAPASHPQAVAVALPPPPPPAQVAVSQPAPPQPSPAAPPKTALPPLSAAALPEPVHAAPPSPVAMALPAPTPAEPAQSAPAAAGPTSPVLPVASLPTSGSPDAQPAPIAAPPVPAAPAAQAPAAPAPVAAGAVPKGATTPAAEPFRVRLSFTAEQSNIGEAFARQLRQEGYVVTSTVIHATSGRWPGVAYFFRSDRETARLIARQLTAITGRNEHARMSPRHPYPRPGTIEVSLLRYSKSGGTTGKRAHRLSALTHTHGSREQS